MSMNEHVDLATYPEGFSRVQCSMWRRVPDIPNWRVDVYFGDSGYECDPGVYGEPVEVALEEIDKAILELEALRKKLAPYAE